MSTLPVFEVERVEVDMEDGSHSRYVVTCARCRGEFWVNMAWSFVTPVEGAGGQIAWVVGRPCPYCFKASEIPAEIRSTPEAKKRIVKRRR